MADDVTTTLGSKPKANGDVNSITRPKRIRPLDQDVVNKIAAGEIIVAPVHALKELIENAVDAGSSSLEIIAKEGGMKLLQITDNGHGINKDDLPILCERFTTSKLQSFEDLASMTTYGFRGEALASISHIAHLTVTTKVKESSCAWRAHYSGGNLVPSKPGQSAEPKPTAGRQGTQITVEDLFYNIPTRRKAFHSASEEYSQVLDMVGKYAIHCSGVSFSCKKHGETSIGVLVQRAATTVDRIRNIYGSVVANELIHVEADDEQWGFKANAYVTTANYNGKRFRLLLFINHRAVESLSVKKAIEATYSHFMPKGAHSFVYLSLEIDPQRVDVNVHPTKRQVNFLNEDEIIELICEAIRSKLGSVDTSRTFVTQSLLPGVKIPTISADSVNSTPRRGISISDPSHGHGRQAVPHTPAPRTPSYKPYENNLVRTDAKAQKITAFMKPSVITRDRSPSRTDSVVREHSIPIEDDDFDKEYVYTERGPMPCKLASIKSLRAVVQTNMHESLTEIFTTHTYIGLVDHARRIAAIQSGVKLYLVDYGLVCAEFFYQLGLTDFGNFGGIRLSSPLDLRELMKLAIDDEKADISPEKADTVDWEQAVERAALTLIERREMLEEYFRVDVTENGMLYGLPLLLKGYMPPLGKLSRFLLRLGPKVDWNDESDCFRTLLREIAAWYVPEVVPNTPGSWGVPIKAGEDIDTESDAQSQVQQDSAEPTALTERRGEITRAVETVLFPAFKARLVATKGMVPGVVEVADLKGLYRVFERC